MTPWVTRHTTAKIHGRREIPSLHVTGYAVVQYTTDVKSNTMYNNRLTDMYHWYKKYLYLIFIKMIINTRSVYISSVCNNNKRKIRSLFVKKVDFTISQFCDIPLYATFSTWLKVVSLKRRTTVIPDNIFHEKCFEVYDRLLYMYDWM